MTVDRLVVAAVLTAICLFAAAGSCALYGLLNRIAASNHRRRNRMTTTPPVKQGTHFWHMTIQAPNERGFHVGSYQGTHTPRQGQTRLDLFNSIRSEIDELRPEARGGIVLTFDLQPNQL